MKIVVSNFCFQCLNEDSSNYEELRNELIKENKLHIEIELNSENEYFIECKNGHTQALKLQAENFEILFDLATLALIDGYSKEAFSTLYSSYERFIEFTIKIICHSKSINKEEFIEGWKLVKKQSERQLGAFYIIQLIEFGKIEFELPKKWIEIRNQVIHNGEIPSSKKVIEFGNDLLNFIFSILEKLNEKYPNSLTGKQRKWLDSNTAKYFNSQIYASSLIPTIIGLNNLNFSLQNKETYEEIIETVKNNGFYKSFYSKK
ncbi:hypothetical protein [Flavobacterium sp. NRK F7]|uniref:hypothetical protein n=1 Tax=Flavobacterium sp. NRK F7 TaxID=2954930 RepID=UPI00209075B7|nr:hypothetical protein [Flavobacterium sp. NRK F7]MCO6163820.1 hypothetical protein [Flavobacterium sp. NRK F7]